MKKLFLVIALFLFTTVAWGKPHQLSWVLPIDNCDGTALIQADLIQQELVYGASAMPMNSDGAGPCAVIPDAEAPPGTLSVAVPATDTSVILNLQPGQTYFARIRVSAYVDGNWSSWSNQVQFVVPYGRPNIIRLSSSLLGRMEYWAVSTSSLKFFRDST